jgi:hypothetical protein
MIAQEQHSTLTGHKTGPYAAHPIQEPHAGQKQNPEK